MNFSSQFSVPNRTSYVFWLILHTDSKPFEVFQIPLLAENKEPHNVWTQKPIILLYINF